MTPSGYAGGGAGVQVDVNWLQVNHSLVLNRDADWKDDTAGKSLVCNTQTGSKKLLYKAG